MKKSDFVDLLKSRVLVCDGAMGTMLYAKGISYKHCFDEQNLSNPRLVLSIHQEYIDAGADIIETNTFGANRIRLSEHGLEHRVQLINREGVKIAREAAGDSILVAGSVGPLGKPIAPLGRIPEEAARSTFEEQIECLSEAGVDIILIETISDLNEMKIVLSTAKEIFEGPVIAQMSFSDEGKTLMGDKPGEFVAVSEELGADVMGVNCSVGPQEIMEVVKQLLSYTSLPVSVQPNAGVPRYIDGRYIYLTSPAYMADCGVQFVEMGVSIVGGCCGTTPDHIKLLAERAKRAAGRVKGRRVVYPAAVEAVEREVEIKGVETSLSKKLGEKFVVSVELDPPRGFDVKKLIQGAILCKSNGVDLVNIADSPLARARMSPVALAHLISENVGMETLLHISCRDRNVLGLQSELMGAHALGIRNILAVTGDPPKMGDYPDATGVFDIDSVGLVAMINDLNRGMDLAGREVEQSTSFYVGVGVNPIAIDLKREKDKFLRKVEAGAKFALTQPLFNLNDLERFLREFDPPF
ncbi:MAG: bifunctional homocysteine S-methyltransferase/methylenetetrahydrofolate reductase, partial [Fidelibacterota bacterium]